MRTVYLTYLTQKKDEKKLSYDDMVPRTNMSKSKIQRIFTGQQEPTVSDLETIVEKGLQEDIDTLYAMIGKREMRDSEELDFKGAKALMDEFATEKARIHATYEAKLNSLVEQSDKRQQAFTDALNQMGEQYRKNADYMKGVIVDNEGYIRDLLAKVEHANAIADSERNRAEDAEGRIEELDKRRHHVFWGMLGVVIVLLCIIVVSIAFDIPAFNWGNK